ncbi:CoA transferase [Hydrogenophaga sp. 2FB]|uniref:CaiB/BaiF CoA transferase family protein n=1 Tax=Hydrogenophaga sp. 2FB TaxID=2502187 RepID=UPI0010F4C023|nr:CoA transferase [Hydrogenophaga sp. 2FB]
MENHKESQGSGPLKGLRVVELGMLFAGPLIATNLADLGAEIIKIEHPKGDVVRGLGQGDNSLWWSVVARNKKLVGVDVKKPEGADIVRRLLATADVFIENFRPGRVKEWGLDYDTLRKVNPGLVMLHVSGYGQTGPYSERPGVGTLAEAFSGYAHVTGEPDGPPTLPSFPLADGVAALTGTYAVLAALWARDRNGGIGDEIDISLYEPLLSMTGPMLINFTKGGVVSNREGNRARWSTPRNTYKTRDDRWIAVSSAADSPAMRLFQAIGREDLTTNPAWATNRERLKRVDECDSMIAAWMLLHTQAEIMERLNEFDVLAAPVNDIEGILKDPHVQQRGSVVSIPDPVLGDTVVQEVVPRFRNAPGKINWLGRHEVGTDTLEFMVEAGFSTGEIQKLHRSGIVKVS